MLGLVSDCIGLSEKTENSTWQWSLMLNGCNTFTLYIASGSLLNTSSKQLFALVADWNTCEKPLVIEKFKSSSSVAYNACMRIGKQLPNVPRRLLVGLRLGFEDTAEVVLRDARKLRLEPDTRNKSTNPDLSPA